MKNVEKMKRSKEAMVQIMQGMLAAQEARSDKKMTDAEQRQYNALEENVNQWNDQIKVAEIENAREAGTASGPVRSRTGIKYKDLFGISGDEERTYNFCQALASGRGIPEEFRMAAIGDGAKGGFAISDEVSAIFFDGSLDVGIVRKRAQNWPMTANTRNVPAFDSQDQSASVHGFVGQWRGEGGTFDIQDPAMRKIILSCKSLGIFTAASNEIMADGGTDFATKLQQAIALSIAFYSDAAFIGGSGVGEPLGALKSACVLKVNRQSAGHVVYKDLAGIYSKMLPSGLATAVWLVSQTALVDLFTLEDTNGNLILPDLKNGLLGLPIIVTDHVSSLGTEADIGLYDFNSYAVGIRKELTFESTTAYKWTENRLDCRMIMRADGQPVYSKAITTKNGDQVSPFVILK